jgi:Cof subfamily protein (haloacid dehalogenase superfamily)
LAAQNRDGLGFDLAAFDLDGTLLRRDLKITDRSRGALDDLRERGLRLVVATGRRYESAAEQAGRLGFEEEDPVVCYGGSMVRRIGGETLLHRTIDAGLSLEVLDWAADRDLHARVFLDGKVVTSQNSAAVDRFVRREPGVYAIDSPSAWLRESGERPTKLVIVDNPDDVPGWLEEAREAFRGRLFVTRSLPHYVEIGNPEGTKSEALSFLCERWGIGAERVLAFGDADNDVDMLRFAGCGVAVGPMTEEVREAADEVVPNVDEDGVALFVERLLEDS